MIEFFNNIWSWINENKETITVVLTSTEFAAIVGIIITVWKNVISNRKNTLSVDSLKAVVSENTEVKNEVKAIGNELKVTSEDVKALAKTAEELSVVVSSVNDKMSCLLEALSIVYSTIRDDNVRVAVTALLNTAKYSDEIEREQLKNEIAVLKQELTDIVAKFDAKADESLKAIEAPTTDTKSNKKPRRH